MLLEGNIFVVCMQIAIFLGSIALVGGFSMTNKLESVSSTISKINSSIESNEKNNIYRITKSFIFSQQRQHVSSRSKREPTITIFDKLIRRCTVFWVAFRMFLEYKWAGRNARKLKKRLGLLIDSDSDDHPEILKLWSNVHARNAVRLLKQIKDLAGFWVKVGQYLSTRADIMPPEYLRSLAELQDSMPSKNFHDVLATIQEELDDDSLALIEYIDPEPLSTASLAQVHRARLKRDKNGVTGGVGYGVHEVVLKVQHRGVASLMLQDMENLRVILELLAKTDPDLDYGPIIKEYNQEVKKELDFRIEAQNMQEVSDLLCEHNVRAIIPKTIPGLVKKRILVMDFCEGFPVKDLKSMDKYDVDRKLLLQRVCSAWAIQMHVGGVFNADPHSGNILVSTSVDGDASVPVLLDFGLTKRLDPAIKLAFARLMHASYEGDIDALIQSFHEMGLKMNRHDPMEDMAAMQRGFGDTVPQTQAREVQKQKSADNKRRMEAQRAEAGLKKGQKLRNPVEAWPSELVFFGRVTNMLRGLCSQLNISYPYLNTMAMVSKETIKASVPSIEHADTLIHSSASSITTNLQQKLLDALPLIEREGHMVGLQICVLRGGKEIANIAAGTVGIANPRPVTPSTLFNIFSVSKGVLTIGLLRLLQDGRIKSLDDPVCKYWSAFSNKSTITVRHLLTHQAGLSNTYPEDATLDTLLDWQMMTNFMAKHAIPSHEPGKETEYHALTFAWLIGGLIERVTGRPYEEFFDNLLADTRTTITSTRDKGLIYLAGIPKSLNDDKDLAVLSVDQRNDSQQQRNDSQQQRNEETLFVGEVSDEEERRKKARKQLAKYRGMQHLMNPSVFNMRKVREAKIPSANGHASASSLAYVFDALIRPKDPILTPDILAEARLPNLSSSSLDKKHNSMMLNDSNSPFGLGFQLHEFLLANGDKVTSIGHSGIGGSVVLAVPEERVVIALTVNHLSKDCAARQRLFDVVFNDLGWIPPPSIMPVQT